MWRAFFMAMGVSAVILGGEFLVAEKLVLASETKQPQSNGFFAAPVVARKREVTPPEWAPWSLLSVGTVVILYSLTLPKSGNGAPEGHG